MAHHIISYKDLSSEIQEIQKKGMLVLVGGCFDILHTGHIEFLKKAKEQGDTLLVMLEADSAITRRKGINRPINTQKKRAENLMKLPNVDYVLCLTDLKTDLEYYNLVKTLRPDIIAITANDPAYNKKNEQANMVGGRVVEVIERIEKHSTTNLIKKEQ